MTATRTSGGGGGGRLRVGLLGSGYWALEAHGAALAAHERVELVGVWGRDPGRAAATGAKLGVPGTGDVDALLEQVDAVAIALPPHVQAPLAARAAAAGKHLLLDKPLALDVAGADAVMDAARAAGVASAVFFTARWSPAVDAWLREAARERWDGARGAWFGSIYQPGSPFADSQWRKDYGGLWDVGPHALSVVLPLLGPAVRVSAVAGLGDTVHVTSVHEGGAASALGLSLTVPPEASAADLVVWGPAGAASPPDRGQSAVEAFGRMVDGLLAQLDGGEPVACDVAFARDVVAVLAAASRSLDADGALQPV